ncbi:UPF0721 transmembrane protein [Oxalicibacterium flavum]|uniref:Probable membrane transporter protein n=1 Tax=Oxalicibacterium flavum TaxID=179467 RepID=A0A8J2UQI6_9BURK|nr:sulfite exporter TauE/SafE family protein [Oxalicibacterium flavum]GGC14255.1 UPF0721 transmembrane protein [Oxalicibacterium flavum]
MITHATLILISLGIGVLVGGAGVGGFFMPTALTFFAGVSVHEGTATSLFTFIFLGVAGAIYFHRKGSIDWDLVKPICLGAALTGFAGAWIGSQMSTALLSIVLAVLITAAGLYTLAVGTRVPRAVIGQPRSRWLLLIAIGAFTGFLSGLTGIGGPALSVPLMLFFGFSILHSIGAGQVLQIVGALSGTLANMRYGTIDFGLAFFITAFEIVGVLAGAYLIHRINIDLIRKLVGALCLVAGCAFLLKAL